MSLLDEGRDKLADQLRGKPFEQVCSAMEWEAIRTSLRNLRTFPCIQTLEAKGRVSLHGAHFDIATGALTVLNQATDTFITI